MGQASQPSPALGILQLANRPSSLPGATGAASSYAYPVRFLQVPGAWVEAVVGDDDAILDVYLDCARQLEREGVAAITSNCGFTARFQGPVSAAVGVPVALSSLQLVPFVAALVPPGRRVGVVTYDAAKLTERHCQGAGWSAADTPVAITGIEGSETWTELAKPEPDLDPGRLRQDVLAATRALLHAHPDIAALVLECAAFPPATAMVRRETGLPVADYITLSDMLMAMVDGGALDARAIAG